MHLTNKTKLILLTFIIVVVGSGLYYHWTSNLLNRTGRYSIGTIENVEGARGGLMIYVTFKFRNKNYTINSIDATGEITKSSMGKRLFIKFIPSHPTLSCDYSIDNIVPDSIKEPPYEGWKTLPITSK